MKCDDETTPCQELKQGNALMVLLDLDGEVLEGRPLVLEGHISLSLSLSLYIYEYISRAVRGE